MLELRDHQEIFGSSGVSDLTFAFHGESVIHSTTGIDCGFFRAGFGSPAPEGCCCSATAGRFFLATKSRHVWAKVVRQYSIVVEVLGNPIMSSAKALANLAPVKALATLASVAAAACCLFAFSWVGLALLGF
jgi:hypothetical protein